MFQETNEIDSVLRKAKKLLNLQRNPNEHEATAAAAKLQELLMQHGLSMDDVRTTSDNPVEKVTQETVTYGGDREIEWKTNLLNSIAKANLCRVIIYTERMYRDGRYKSIKTMKLFGKPSNVQVSSDLFLYLGDVIDRLTKYHMATDDRAFGKGYSNSFRLGIVARLNERFQEKLRRMQEEGIKPSEDGSGCTALAVIDHVKKEKAEVNAYINMNVGRLGKGTSRGSSDYNAFRNGMETGSRINLDAQLNNSNRKSLG